MENVNKIITKEIDSREIIRRIEDNFCKLKTENAKLKLENIKLSKKVEKLEKENLALQATINKLNKKIKGYVDLERHERIVVGDTQESLGSFGCWKDDRS